MFKVYLNFVFMGPIFLVNFFLILLNPHALSGRPLTPNVL